jgi:predicted NBD/HSP70 family sugar kinase
MYLSGSTKLVRNLNKQHILNLVRINSELTARQISKETGLQMSTVLYTLKGLEKEGKIQNVGMGKSTTVGGKPPQIWSLCPNYGYIVGMELLSSEIRYIVVNFRGEVIIKNKIRYNNNDTPNSAIQNVVKIFNKIINSQKLSKEYIHGLGVAIPGSIDGSNGLVRFSYALGFQEINLKSVLLEKLKIQVTIENDANAGALGGKWHNFQNHDISHILYLSINQNFSGMGAGFIIDNKLYRGAHGAAGEISSFMTKSIWKNILDKAKKLYSDNCKLCEYQDLEIPLVSDVVSLAKRNDAGAVYILQEVAKLISEKLVLLVDLFDPQLVVIGGDICEAENYIKGNIIKNLKENIVSDCARETPLYFSPFGTYSVAMGSTALILNEIFNSE